MHNATVFMGLNWADYVIIAILIISVVIGLMRGLIREMFSLIVWIAAFWVGFKFSTPLAERFLTSIHSPSVRLIVAFAILFIATLIIGALLSFLLTQLIVKTGLSGTDRMLGLIFGIARGVLLVGILLLLASMTAFNDEDWWKHSVLIPHFQWLVVWLKGFLPAKFAQLSKVAHL